MVQPSSGALFSAFTHCLEILRDALGVDFIRPIYWPDEQGCACPTLEEDENYTMVYATQSGCSLLAQGVDENPVIPLGRAGPTISLNPPKLLCLRHRLNDGRVVAIQVGFSTVSHPNLHKLCCLFLPVLLWANEHVIHQELKERLAGMEKSNENYFVALEAEREWLSYEVHDRIAQTLASVFQQLQAIESVSSISEARQAAIRASLLTREVIRETRSIMKDLHPPMLDDIGLVPLLEEELRQLERETGCLTRLEVVRSVHMPRAMEVVCYRIAHEALVNVRRHSRAKEVVVSMVYKWDGIGFAIRDNGVGFDVAVATGQERIGGLMSLKRRSEMAGGYCRVESSLGQGTLVCVWIPGTPLLEAAQV